jgi:excisionase family DNA binding protein
VAELIGCSRAMAYRLMQRGIIPVVRIPGGKTVRVPREALLEWIKDNTRAGTEATRTQTDTARPDETASTESSHPHGRGGSRTGVRNTRRTDVGR